MSDPAFSRSREAGTRPAPYLKIAATGWISRLLPGARSTIYLGEDHLLHAKQIMLFEKYRRFYFSDIEAISLRIICFMPSKLCSLRNIDAFTFPISRRSPFPRATAGFGCQWSGDFSYSAVCSGISVTRPGV